MMTHRFLLAALLGASTMCFALPALADEPPLSDAKELERADGLFKEANAAFDAKDYQKARALYLEAYGIKKTYDIAGHLGLTEMELGLHRDAAEHLAAAIRGAPPHQGKKPFERVIQELERAKQEVATLFVTAPDGAKLFIDGREVGTAPIVHELFVETGHRRVEAKIGDRVGTEDRDLTKGSTTKITITVPGVAGKVPGPDTPHTARPSWPGWVMGGVGLAAAGVGAALVGVGQAKVSDAETAGTEIAGQGGSCEPVAGPGSERCAEALDTLEGGDAFSTGGIVALGVGGGLLIAGIIYLLVPDTAAPSEKPALGFVPWMTPQGGGLVIRGGF